MQKKEFVRNPYNYDADKISDQTGLLCEDESLAQQQFLEESDINYIADRFMKTGELKQVVDLPTNGDFEGIFDFQSAMNLIKDAKDEFMKLPAKMRSRFDNDPQKVIAFIEDEANREEAQAIGLIPKPPKEAIDGSRSESRPSGGSQDQERDSRASAAQGAPGSAKGPGQEAASQDRSGAKK